MGKSIARPERANSPKALKLTQGAMKTDKIEGPRGIHTYENAWNKFREIMDGSDEWILLNCRHNAVCNGHCCVLGAAFLIHLS